VSGTKYSVLYGYNNDGNVKSMVYPDGYNITMTYDAVDRLKTLGSFATIHYTLDDSIGTISYGNGVTATYSYDTRDRPTQIKVTNPSGTKEMDLNYTYDATNNVLSIGTETYTYNWLNEMNSSTGPWGDDQVLVRWRRQHPDEDGRNDDDDLLVRRLQPP